jgi:phenylalanyl-tRNA synthetase beta chain
MKTPDLRPTTVPLSISYANRILGMDFSRDEAKKFLEKMRHGADLDAKDTDRINVIVASYRTDILHQMDLVEDIAIAYGYANFAPRMPRIATIGAKDPLETYSDTCRELMLGLSFQEVMTLIMTNRKDLFTRMDCPEEPVAEAENPVSSEHSIARTWLMPSLLSVLEKNKNREYPQRVFEIGDCILADGGERRKIAGVIAHSKVNYSEIKAVVCGLLESLGAKPEVSALSHPSCIAGRCASCAPGFFGEISPKVLEGFGLEVPVAGFELDIRLMSNKPI